MECDSDTFWNFGQFFALLPTPTHPSTPAPLLTIQKKKLWKNEKTPWDIIILHMCTINDNHMMYGSWDMNCNWQKFLSFWTIFCPFALNPKIFEKLKNMPRDGTLHKCTKNHDHMLHCSCDTTCDRCNFYFSICANFCLLPP